MLGIIVCWAANFVAIKAAVGEMPPIAVSFVRFGAGGLLLLVALRWREGSVGLPRRDALAIAGLGVIGFGLYQALWSTALVWTTAGDSSLLVATTPIWTALVAVLAGSDTLGREKLAGAAVAFLGVGIIVWGSEVGAAGTSSWLGAAMTLAAAACWAVYVAFGANVLRRHSPLRATTWAVLAGTLAIAPLALAQLRTWDPRLLTPEVPLALAYSALLAVAAANVVNFRAVQLLGPTRVTAYQFLTPAFAVLLAALLLGEGIRPEQVVGGLVIVLGILVMRRAPVRVRAVHGPGERADVPGPSSQGPA